ncbi:MAG: acyltransferase family protein [Gemmatimonadaceae bacterium]
MSTAVPRTAEAAASTYRASFDAPPASRERLIALDVFRGLTIAGMLLVNNPGSWGAIYPPLRHAAWHGWTPTDLIFPFFLFIVGITTHLSLEGRRARGDDGGKLVRQVLRRGGIIILLGLFLSGFPFVPAYGFDLSTMRIPGVLQRIGVAYIAAALLTLRTSSRTQIAIAGALLFGYWAVMTLVPVPGGGVGTTTLDSPDASLAAWLDRTLLGNHLWRVSRTWDPEGILSTIPAIATAMLGVFAGRWIASPRGLMERLAGLFAIGSLGMVVGLIWGWFFPINKNLWTSSYVLFTAGMACVVVATCIWLIDANRVSGWTKPFVIYGMNPILAFVGSGMMARLMGSIITVERDGQSVSLQRAIYDAAFASWLAPMNASLLYALCFVLLWFGILAVLHRKRIFLKV